MQFINAPTTVAIIASALKSRYELDTHFCVIVFRHFGPSIPSKLEIQMVILDQ